MKDYIMAGGLIAAFLAFRHALRSIILPPPRNGVPDPFPAQQQVMATGVCDPTPKPGVVAFRAFVLERFGGTDLGIARDCAQGGKSEHKEGRAWDWGIRVDKADQKAAAAALLSFLEKDDWANARRLGIGYVIWDRRIWSAWKRTAGWRPYDGADPHTTHMHLSWSHDGAMAKTSGYAGGKVAL